MLIKNWLAIKDGAGGLAFPSEFGKCDVRIYGNIYGHPQFSDGDYVRTSLVVSFTEGKVVTSEGIEFALLEEHPQYLNFLKSAERGAIVVKDWCVINGNLAGRTLESYAIEGKVISQSFKTNICVLEDGRKFFVDWLSRDPDYIPDLRGEQLLVFCIENCMPDIFCKHYHLFK